MSDDSGTLSPVSVPSPSGIEVRKAGYSVYLNIPDNKQECRCSYIPHEQGAMLTHDGLVEILKQHGVVNGIDQEALSSFAINAAAGRQQHKVLLASWEPPVNGADEYFEPSTAFTTVVRNDDDTSAGVEAQTFVTVFPDQEIGRIIPLSLGIPGKNIKGEIVLPKSGKPLKCRIGKNIRFEEEGARLIATAVGRFCNTSREILVEQEIFIQDNTLECRCSYVPRGLGATLTRDELVKIFKLYGLFNGLDKEVFEDFVVNVAAGQRQLDVLLSAGTAPVNGTDEYFEQLIAPSTVVQSGDDESNSFDMYMVQTFINVSSDEKIGRIIPPTPGIPGKNIRGELIPPQPGKTLKRKIGKNIRTEEDGTLLIATAPGRFCQSAVEFSVEQELVVKGDVDFRVGTINFNGFVEVRGDVLDNFNIMATKGVNVTGNIGTCSINSEGDIAFCGMNKGSIVCGGALRARYIHDTVIECAGDVIVEIEIHNCTIKTLGRIIVNKDTIAGGSCIALGGIEANKLGSPSARPTTLLVGVDYRDLEELKRLLGEMAETHEKISGARSLDEIIVLRKTAACLSESISTIRGKTVAAANAKINVKATLHENVRLTVGNVSQVVRENRVGPLTIIENIVDGGLRFIPMSALDVNAINIEMALIEENRILILEQNRKKTTVLSMRYSLTGNHLTYAGVKRARMRSNGP